MNNKYIWITLVAGLESMIGMELLYAGYFGWQGILIALSLILFVVFIILSTLLAFQRDIEEGRVKREVWRGEDIAIIEQGAERYYVPLIKKEGI